MIKGIKYDYWIFYIDKKVIDKTPVIVNHDTLIYAYTDDENLYNKFMDTHNMGYFTVRKNHLTKDEIHYLSTVERNKYIVECKFLTRGKQGDKIYVTLCVTMEENKISKLVTSSKINEYIFKYSKVKYPRKMFRKKVRRILEVIGIFDTEEMYSGDIPISADSEKFIINTLYGVLNLYVDELSVFSDVFSRVLKVGD